MKNYYFAPLEGISGYIYRNAYAEFFGKIEKYFIPFIHPNQKGKFSSREKNDILPEHNAGMYAVPQIMTNCAEDFLSTAEKLSQYRYQEINLNLGCPSRTVVSKGRGSGFLAYPDKLDEFLYQIYERTDLRISIKTRIGVEDPEEFGQILEIYNKYPVSELIIHPRVQTDFYRNKPNIEVFRMASEISKNPLCYNGDLYGVQDLEKIAEEFPNLESVMLGRGILKNPGLILEAKEGTALDKKRLRAFHDRILQEYEKTLFGEKPVLFKMKELWFYMAELFTEHEKYAKKIKKAQRLEQYRQSVDALFSEQELKSGQKTESF